jgi:hypothetical protein
MKYKKQKSNQYDGFYEIPNYSKYVINEFGNVKNKISV